MTKEETNAQRAAYRAANREKIQAREAAYRAANAEKIKMYLAATSERRKVRQAAYYVANREKMNAASRARHVANLEEDKEAQKVWRDANLESIRDRRRKKQFGISPGAFQLMLLGQRNACGICKESFLQVKPNIDHDHITGEVRGLLCGRCNKGLGLFRDSPDFLKSALEYLEA